MRRLILLIGVFPLGMTGCNTVQVPKKIAMTAAPAGVSQEAPPADLLENGQPSLKALAELALQAVEARDMLALNSLRVTEREYKEIFFPEFPEARPGNNLPPDFHWFHLNLKSLKGLQDIMDQFGGQSFELMDIVVTQGVQEYTTFKAHKKVELKVRRVPNGEELQIRLFGSVIERRGQFKIFSFPS